MEVVVIRSCQEMECNVEWLNDNDNDNVGKENMLNTSIMFKSIK